VAEPAAAPPVRIAAGPFEIAGIPAAAVKNAAFVWLALSGFAFRRSSALRLSAAIPCHPSAARELD
jgi:hypothetical protein